MSEISRPIFGVTYYRPWHNDANLYDSWCNYLKDTSVAKYSADLVGSHIQDAARQLNLCVEKQTEAIQIAAQEVNLKLDNISHELAGVNHRLELSIDQQRLSNFLLGNIAELLKIPDSEKERQKAISLGVSFLVKAKLDDDLYDDALSEFTKAYELMPQDYFVLYRLGLIHLFSHKHIDFKKAADFFMKAAKYAYVDSDEELQKITKALALTGDGNNAQFNYKDIIADSYDNAALAFYCLGNDNEAIKNQGKAIEICSSPERLFSQAKYQFRNGDVISGSENLKKSIIEKPILINAAFQDPDIIIHEESISVIKSLNNELDSKCDKICKLLNDYSDDWVIKKRKETEIAKTLSYVERSIAIENLSKLPEQIKQLSKTKDSILTQIDTLKGKIQNGYYVFTRPEYVGEILQKLDMICNYDISSIEKEFDIFKKQFNSFLPKIGDNYGGGKIGWLNKDNNGGIIISTKKYSSEYGKLLFRSYKSSITMIEAYRKLKNGFGDGLSRTVFLARYMSSGKDTVAYSMYSKQQFNGYDDWFIPTESELEEIHKNLHFYGDYAINEIEYSIFNKEYYGGKFRRFKANDVDYFYYPLDPYKYCLAENYFSEYLYPIRTFGHFSETVKIKNPIPAIDNQSKEKSNGCYIATCVYGSYDCPEVWTLRRFRDNALAKTWYGNIFIKTYYAISPRLVSIFGERPLFRLFNKQWLDKFVKCLQRNGFSSLPYSD